MKLLVFSLFIAFSVFGQLPDTDIWLFKIEKKDNKFIYSNPKNITNRIGYDNQPTFSTDDKSILYVNIDSSKQADIYKYDISKRTYTNLTKSVVSEYSPLLLPNGLSFSSVVVEKDSSQRIWQFNLDGSFKSIIHEQTDSVGYYTWLSNDSVLYYKLTNPHSLRVLNIKTHEDAWLCDYPTRSFKKEGASNKFIYAIKDSASIEFRMYEPLLKKSSYYATYHSLNEDFIWHADFGLIKSEGSDLLNYNMQSKTWNVLFSFANLGIKKITRFVFDHKTKQLAIVSNL